MTRTANQQIALAPFEVAENGIEGHGCVCDEHDFVDVRAEQSRNCLPDEECVSARGSSWFSTGESYRDLTIIGL